MNTKEIKLMKELNINILDLTTIIKNNDLTLKDPYLSQVRLIDQKCDEVKQILIKAMKETKK